MAKPTPPVPPYSHHKATGRAFVKVAGRFHYLGAYGSPASREAYARVIRDIQIAGPGATVTRADVARRLIEPDAVTVTAVLAAFWTHAKTAYPYDPSYDGRRPPGEIGNYYDAMQPVLAIHATTAAVNFGPLALATVQQEMIGRGWCRNVINRHTSRIKMMFRWAASKELIPGRVVENLNTATGLRKGHPGVRNTPKVRPVPESHLNATVAFCSPRIAAMVRVQLLTGMRSGNLCQMRMSDVDRKGSDRGNWLYRPRSHKTAHHDHELVIHIGPQAQAVLAPYLKPDDPEAFVFSPAEEAEERRVERSAKRVTPLSCGNRPKKVPRKLKPKRAPGEHYTPRTYAQAIDRACDLADRWAKGGMVIDPADRVIPRWHPHRLRHNKGTKVRGSFGVDGVQAALAQKTAAISAMYAEIEAEKADQIAAEMG